MTYYYALLDVFILKLKSHFIRDIKYYQVIKNAKILNILTKAYLYFFKKNFF